MELQFHHLVKTYIIKYMMPEKIIGVSEGIDTPYIRVECSQGVIHGHPITKKEYLKRLGAI